MIYVESTSTAGSVNGTVRFLRHGDAIRTTRQEAAMQERENESGDALRRARNIGLEQEQERQKDPAHFTPEEAGEDPHPAEPLTEDENAGASPERLKNPPQIKGPRERQNRMV
jgi:hypothetical protein